MNLTTMFNQGNGKTKATPRATEKALWNKLNNDDSLTDKQRECIINELDKIARIRDGKSQTASVWTKVLIGGACMLFMTAAGYGMDLFDVISSNRNSMDGAKRNVRL